RAPAAGDSCAAVPPSCRCRPRRRSSCRWCLAATAARHPGVPPRSGRWCPGAPLDCQYPPRVPGRGCLALPTSCCPPTTQAPMRPSPVLRQLSSGPGVAALLAAAEERVSEADVSVAPGTRPVVVATLAGRGPVLAVTAAGREAEDLAAALADFLPADAMVTFPSWATLP